MDVPDKVTTPPITGGNPFKNLTATDLKRDDTSQTTSLTSRVEVTISGRVVYRPISK